MLAELGLKARVGVGKSSGSGVRVEPRSDVGVGALGSRRIGAGVKVGNNPPPVLLGEGVRLAVAVGGSVGTMICAVGTHAVKASNKRSPIVCHFAKNANFASFCIHKLRIFQSRLYAKKLGLCYPDSNSLVLVYFISLERMLLWSEFTAL